jgi:CBS-domain-containing membrane protein
MKSHHALVLAVVDANQVVTGILDMRDLFRAALPDYLLRMNDLAFVPDFAPLKEFWQKETSRKVRDLMHTDAACVIQTNMSYTELIFLITKRYLPYFLVVDDNHRYIGTITLCAVFDKLIRP